MFHRFIRWVILVSAFLGTLTPVKAGAFELSAAAGMELTFVSATPMPQNLSLSSKLGSGVGALIAQSINRSLQVETGLMYMPRIFSKIYSPTDIESKFTANYLIVPVELKYTALQFVSFGAGFYWADALSDILPETISPSGSGTPQLGTAVSFADARLKSSDFGALVDARLKMPILPTLSWFLDARYLVGLSNINEDPAAPDAVEKDSQLQVLLGLTFGL